jgi:UDP-N-acetylmuramate dehydrogenase
MSARDELQVLFADRVREHVPLAPFTTFGVGGPADLLVETQSSEEIEGALEIARRWQLPVTLLGGGSNVLVADAGIRGLVLRPRRGIITTPRPDLVRADAAVTLNGLVRWTVGRGFAGMEAWAGTPGTVGGGIHGNAHFQGRLLSEHVVRVALVAPGGGREIVPAAAMAFGYDRSRLQSTGEVLLWAEFRVGRGVPGELRERARASLQYRKQTQPLHLPSAGCVFQNPDPLDPVPDGVPRSAGALIDRAGLKGAACGGARVSPVHANFIVNEGGATARDIRALIERCRQGVLDRFGVRLRDEIVYLGTFAPPATTGPR